MDKRLLRIPFLMVFLFLVIQAAPLVAREIQLGSDFALTAAFLGDQVYVPHVAYNSKHKEYLVVYQWKNPTLFPGINRQIHGARISDEGKYYDNFIISDLPNDCAQADVSYDPVNDRYLVAWMYDTGANGKFDLQGRFVPTSGPDPGLPSFMISQFAGVDEYSPRLAYNSAWKDFLVVTNLLRNDALPIKPYIIGMRIKADGSGLPGGGSPDFTIGNVSENIVHPDVVYNSVRDEYLVVYDNVADIFAQRINGFTGGSTGDEIDVAGWPGTEDRPAVSYCRREDTYVITWDANRLSGNGAVYGRFVQGDGTVTTVFRLDDDTGGVRPDFTSDVACKQTGDECLALWIGVHNNTYYTFGRQFHVGGSFYNGMPYVNLNTIASWGGVEPQLAIAGGSKNYFMAFKNNSLGAAAISIWGQPTLKSFPWNLFLNGIINKKKR